MINDIVILLDNFRWWSTRLHVTIAFCHCDSLQNDFNQSLYKAVFWLNRVWDSRICNTESKIKLECPPTLSSDFLTTDSSIQLCMTYILQAGSKWLLLGLMVLVTTRWRLCVTWPGRFVNALLHQIIPSVKSRILHLLSSNGTVLRMAAHFWSILRKDRLWRLEAEFGLREGESAPFELVYRCSYFRVIAYRSDTGGKTAQLPWSL